MSELDVNALKDALKIEKDLKSFVEKYGRDALNTILESIDFYSLIGLVNPESVDEKELATLAKKSPNDVEDNNDDSAKTPGPYESDDLNKFGLYKDIMEAKTEPAMDVSIYSQNPETLSKVVEDKKNQSLKDKNLQVDDIDDDDIDVIIPDSYSDNVDEPEEKPLTKVKNPWESAGSPISPGQIKF